MNGKRWSEVRKFLLYAFRWQLSTPILWAVLMCLGRSIWATIAANLVGACIFYYVDKKFIFKENAHANSSNTILPERTGV